MAARAAPARLARARHAGRGGADEDAAGERAADLTASWADLEAQAADLAAAGRRLFRADGAPIGFLATVAADGGPRLAPVCPIFAGRGVHLSIGAHTPKLRDLRRSGRYALHAFLGPDDEEFRIAGHAVEILDAEERGAVHHAVRFGAYVAEDPVFRLDVDRVLWVRWENPGRPGMRAIRRSWTPASGVRESVWTPTSARPGGGG